MAAVILKVQDYAHCIETHALIEVEGKMDKEIQFYVFFCKVEIKDLKDFLQISPRGLPFASKLIKHLGQSLQTEGYPHAPASH